MYNAQTTSIEAYRDIQPELSHRQSVVYNIIRSHKAINNMMISKTLSAPINSITPRTHELRELGLVTEAFKAICPYTKRKTIFWQCALKPKHLITN